MGKIFLKIRSPQKGFCNILILVLLFGKIIPRAAGENA